jgi:hypothetical protein
MRISFNPAIAATSPVRRLNKKYIRPTEDDESTAIAEASSAAQDISPLAHSMAHEAAHHNYEPTSELKGRKFALLNNLAKSLG